MRRLLIMAGVVAVGAVVVRVAGPDIRRYLRISRM